MVEFRENPVLENPELNRLFAASWVDHVERDFHPILDRSLACVAAYHEHQLIGFVNVASDGAEHAFLLDTTVHPDFRRRGIGVQLVERAAALAQTAGAKCLHVDFEERLSRFYFGGCGFKATSAGLMRFH